MMPEPRHTTLAPQPIPTRDDLSRALVVNRVRDGENVVLSWRDERGLRDALGLSPREARFLARALLVAADVADGGDR